MLHPDKALKMILEEMRKPQTERVPIVEALDRVLAEQIVSTLDSPPFAKSAMDGYAVCRDDSRRRHVLSENPWIGEALSIGGTEALESIEHNASVIEEHYSHEPSGRRLLRIYRQVESSPRGDDPGPLPHGERILDAFLDFRRFRPIRS